MVSSKKAFYLLLSFMLIFNRAPEASELVQDNTPISIIVRGNLDKIIINEIGLYEGNLVRYFQIVFNNAKNLNLPYHNFRHMMHMVWLCHCACNFYLGTISPREMRNLLIAAMFHDFDHRGTIGDDDLNIQLAIRGLEKHILPEDLAHLRDIKTIIQATEYPNTTPSTELDLLSQIIRDADSSQALNAAWIQEVIFGLAAEWKKPPIEILRVQESFHRNLKFNTEWAKQMWPQYYIEEKINEANNLLHILETPL